MQAKEEEKEREKEGIPEARVPAPGRGLKERGEDRWRAIGDAIRVRTHAASTVGWARPTVCLMKRKPKLSL